MSGGQDVVLCECGEPAEPDVCPYTAEVDDVEIPCNCCEKCRQECAANI
jgi:hypothetical protein